MHCIVAKSKKFSLINRSERHSLKTVIFTLFCNLKFLEIVRILHKILNHLSIPQNRLNLEKQFCNKSSLEEQTLWVQDRVAKSSKIKEQTVTRLN